MAKKSLKSDKESSCIMISSRILICHFVVAREFGGSAPDDADWPDWLGYGGLGATSLKPKRNTTSRLPVFCPSSCAVIVLPSSSFTTYRILHSSGVTINHNLKNNGVPEYKKLKSLKIVGVSMLQKIIITSNFLFKSEFIVYELCKNNNHTTYIHVTIVTRRNVVK